MNLLSTTSLLLKHQLDLFDAILNKKIKAGQVLELLSISLIGLAIFGVVISLAFPHWWHALNLMWKMIVLIMGSQALCLPALYVFSSIRGSRLTLAQLLLFVCAGIATTAVVLLSLAPISWFFTWSTDGNTQIIQVLNTLMIGFGIVFGIILLMRAFQAGYKHYKEQYPDNKSAADILVLWLLLVVVVTVQMGQKLGPWYLDNVGTATPTAVTGSLTVEHLVLETVNYEPGTTTPSVSTPTEIFYAPAVGGRISSEVSPTVTTNFFSDSVGGIGYSFLPAELAEDLAAEIGTTVSDDGVVMRFSEPNYYGPGNPHLVELLIEPVWKPQAEWIDEAKITPYTYTVTSNNDNDQYATIERYTIDPDTHQIIQHDRLDPETNLPYESIIVRSRETLTVDSNFMTFDGWRNDVGAADVPVVESQL